MITETSFPSQASTHSSTKGTRREGAERSLPARILSIDDEPVNQEVLRAVFEEVAGVPADAARSQGCFKAFI